MAEPCLAIAENREDVYKYTAKTIGGSIAWNSSARSTIDFNRTSYTILPDSILLFQGMISGTNRWANIVSSMYGERKLRNGEQVTMGMDYIYFKNNNPT